MKFVFIICLSVFISISVNAQYISEVLSYTPAPGQFINTIYGNPDAAQSIIGGTNGTVSLGAFGGYIIFKLENPIDNSPENPFGIDFTIFGNATGSNSEPAIVSVMKDENKNGLPDDTWFELAGSNYFFSSTVHNYEITYTNPNQSSATDIPWYDNTGENGYVFANDYHTQPYYPSSENFPDINQTEYSLSGTKISGNINKTNESYIISYPAAFGYADNKKRGDMTSSLPDNPYTSETEGMGGDSFDISWAVDQNGNYIDLDTIHFIKVYCAVNDNLGWLGEVSSEISGAIDIAPEISVTGTEDMIVIKDLPPVVYIDSSYQMETFIFNKGHLQNSANFTWSVNLNGASIDENNVLHLTQTGNLTVTATLTDNPDILYSVSSFVSEPEKNENINKFQIKIIPNPASDYLQIPGINNASISIYDYYGRIVLRIQNVSENQKVNISSLKQGFYFIKINKNKKSLIKNLIINRN